MSFESIIYEKEDHISTLTLNRPERLNAISTTMTEEIRLCLDQAMSDLDVRILIITGAGRGFCSGADLSDLGARAGDVIKNIVTKHPSAGGIKIFTTALLNFEKPIIAAVNGPVAGAGLALALACDIRIASDRANFSVTARSNSIPSLGISPAAASSSTWRKGLGEGLS